MTISLPHLPTPSNEWLEVRESEIHGCGVFALKAIPAGTRIIEYTGERISGEEADRRHPVNPNDPNHTFYFAISNNIIIDGGHQGNESRWINHSCEPNCEAEETEDGRVYINSLYDIAKGEELFFDYGLVIDARYTKKLKQQYACYCQTESCRGTMLADKPKTKSKSSA